MVDLKKNKRQIIDKFRKSQQSMKYILTFLVKSRASEENKQVEHEVCYKLVPGAHKCLGSKGGW